MSFVFVSCPYEQAVNGNKNLPVIVIAVAMCVHSEALVFEWACKIRARLERWSDRVWVGKERGGKRQWHAVPSSLPPNC